MTELTVAFFGSMIDSGTPRGALRLFRALADELAQRDDLRLICLGEPAFDPFDSVGCAYECWDGREYLSVLREGPFPAAVEVGVRPARIVLSEAADETWSQRAEHFMSAYRRKVPLTIRHPLSGLTRAFRSILPLPPDQPVPEQVASRPKFPETLYRPGSESGETFRNTDVVGKVISLTEVDVVLDFWWFHSPRRSPLMAHYRPPNLRVLSWFLDAIPLRVPHWQVGMIPVSEFRGVVQSHLEQADEIVAISQSAAEDIANFFPHVRKPVHIVPCGIFEVDFEVPEGLDYLTRSLSLDSTVPLFTIIGFQEPSKNVPNALRALIKVSQKTGLQLQVFIIGFGEGVNLEDALGPVALELHGRIRIVFGGLVSEIAKRAVLARSTALIYPSKWEGFGIPPLEAMAAGTQVVVSDTPPLRAVCVDLGEYCDPYDVDSIAAAVSRTMAKSPAELIRYVERAHEQAKRYTWRAAAGRLVEVITGKSVTEPVDRLLSQGNAVR